jgi:hypothetical protein
VENSSGTSQKGKIKQGLVMKKKILSHLLMVCFIFLGIQQISVAQLRFGVGVQGGTTGYGAEVTAGITETINVRVGGNLFSYGLDGVMEDQDPNVAYDANFEISNFSAIVDFHPGGKAFKISGGVYLNNFDINADVVPNEAYTMDEKTFQPDKMGSLTANVTYEQKIAPYLGIGFGNVVRSDGGPLKFFTNLGVLYTGAPTLTMEGEGMMGPTEDNAPAFNEGLAEFEFYPVFNLGLSFRIGGGK